MSAAAASADQRCGFIGLGSQGAPIARRIVDAGFPTMLWARRPISLEPYSDTEAKSARTVEELGAWADHVGICVINDDDVRQVCASLVPAMRGGARIAIHSTIHPETCREIGRLAQTRGIGVIDAPVSGGSPAAEAGTLTLMLGGEAEVIAQAMPIFQSFGRLIVELGQLGAGQSAKLINNALLAANIGMADRALQAGERLGIAPPSLLELLGGSSGQSFGLRVRGRMAAPDQFRHGAELLDKDMRLLGEVLGSHDPSFSGMHAAAAGFLANALRERV